MANDDYRMHKFEFGEAVTFRLKFDTPKTGQNQRGTWYLYIVESATETFKFFAEQPLHNALSAYRAGNEVTVTKNKDNGNVNFLVQPTGGQAAPAPAQQAQASAPSSTKQIEDIWLYEYTMLHRGVTRLGLPVDTAALCSAATGMVINRDKQRSLGQVPDLITPAQLTALHAAVDDKKMKSLKERSGATSSKQFTKDEAALIISANTEVTAEQAPPPPPAAETAPPAESEDDLPF